MADLRKNGGAEEAREGRPAPACDVEQNGDDFVREPL